MEAKTVKRVNGPWPAGGLRRAVSDGDALLVADADERVDALAQTQLEAAGLLDLGEGQRAQLLLDAAAVVGDERVRDAEPRGGFELRDVIGAQVAVPEDAEDAVVLLRLAAHG